MAEVRLSELVEYLDGFLQHGDIPDDAGALNGLQVENGGTVRRVAAAVDASARTIEAAAGLGCDLLLVHHGLFWGGNQPVTGRHYRRLEPLIRNGIAVYSSHLPLDVHPEVGNNAVLCRALGIEPAGRFGSYKGADLGYWGTVELKREVLAARLDDVLGRRVHMMPYGPEVVRRVGVITGGAGSMIRAALDADLDAFITGEGAHHTHFDAEEGGVNVFYGGHYATETWGVQALAAHLEQQFGLTWQFIDHPTGL